MRVVATAGHVDHGKSTLVRALTGHETDRLAEERRRGLTIDIGFSWTRLDGVGDTAFVDVPGHIDFIRNMIAGVAVVDAALLVVDAREGWRAQTYEHLHILRTIGVEHVLAVVTKTSLAEPDQLDALLEKTQGQLVDAGLAGAPIVACDALSGAGLDRLRSVLSAVLANVDPRADSGRPRLWIDRSFSVRGAGTVVTGGLTHGPLSVGDEALVVGQDGVTTARIRGIEVLGESSDTAAPGGRTAINLARVDHWSIRRGDALIRADHWHLTDTIDVELDVAPMLNHSVSRRGAFAVHIGTSVLAASVRIIGGESIAPGERGLARIRLPRPLPVVPGDRYVLVESGRRETIGGGQVLDVAPVLPLRAARPDRSVDRVIAERGWVDVDDLQRLTGELTIATTGRWVIDPEALGAERRRLLDHLESAGSAGSPLTSFDSLRRAVLDQLSSEDDVQVRGGMVVAATQADEFDDHPFIRALRAAPFQPPTPTECRVDQPTLTELRRRGLIVTLNGFYFATSAIEEATRIFAGLTAEHPEGVTISQFRTALGTTRKWAMPILAHLDSTGISRRVADIRLAGPRLPSVVATTRTGDALRESLTDEKAVPSPVSRRATDRKRT